MSSDDASAIACAICLTRPLARDVVLVASCLHAYCAKCLVRWYGVERRRRERANGVSDARCPCCTRPFSCVLARRALDGSEDAEGYLRSESMALLARARWCGGDAETEAEGEDEGWSADDDDGDDDGDDVEVEVRTRRRVVLGNRRFGNGGFVANGGSRTFARPTRDARASRGKGTKGGGNAVVSSPGVGSAGSSASSSSASPSSGMGTDQDASSTPRQRGKKSAKRADAMAKKAEKEAQKAANRLAKRAEEAAEAEARRLASIAAKELEQLALET